MSDFDYDLFVIGGGSGGVRAARMSAQHGAKVAIAEEYRYGGTCVIRGCVPKKLMVYASTYHEHFEDAAGFGWTVGDSTFDWKKLIANKDTEIGRLEGIYQRLLDGAGVEHFATRATVKDPHTVHLVAEGRDVTAKQILIATGGWPRKLDIPGAEHAITSNEIFHLEDQPKRAIVIGGGYIAAEFAGILNGLGTDVVLSYRSDLFLRGFDREVREHVADEMRKKGIDLRFNTQPERIEKTDEGLVVHLVGGERLVGDMVMMATGRVPNTHELGLENAGVKLKADGAIAVDDYSQTSVPSIYAVGDVTSRLELTPVAIREGAAFADTVFNATPTKADHAIVPTAIFTQPEIGTVGLSEDVAKIDHEIDVYSAAFRPMVATLSGREERMLMKMIVEKSSQKVLGVHIVGHAAGEMIQMAGIAVKMGATKADFDRTVAVHPTAAEELVTMKTPVR
ncbi:MAG: glutathione-disulfide reductase [Pseudomonadota bacterium]